MNTRFFNRKTFFLTGLLGLAVLLLAACQAAPAATATATQPPAPTATIAPTAAPTATAAATLEVPATGAGGSDSAEAVVNVVDNPTYGPILVDNQGMTLYMFTKDEPGKSNCAEKCLAAWPPLLTQGSPQAGDGVDDSLLGVGTLPDGRQIATYNGMPLYYFVKDQKPGDVTGQDVNQVWYVVSPDGKIIRQAASADDTYSPAEKTAGKGASNEPTVQVADNPTLGRILVDGKGMTLYMFTKDGPDQVNCAGKCLEAWPPLLTQGSPQVGDGVNADLLGTAKLPDGTQIVTYNHMPLYYWAGDTQPGQATGQDVNQVWYVVSPEGEPVGQP